MNGKRWWESKTIWVNALTLIASGLTIVAGSESVDPQIVAVVTGLAIPIVNLILRFVTKMPVVK